LDYKIRGGVLRERWALNKKEKRNRGKLQRSMTACRSWGRVREACIGECLKGRGGNIGGGTGEGINREMDSLPVDG